MEKIYLLITEEDPSMWNQLIALCPDPDNKIIIVESRPAIIGWVLESPLDIFLKSADIPIVLDKIGDIEKKNPSTSTVRFERVFDHYFRFDMAVELLDRDCWPKIDAFIRLYRGDESNGQTLTIEDSRIFRYRFVGADRVVKILSELGDMGEYYLRTVWSVWVETRKINKALTNNFDSVHPFARYNLSFRNLEVLNHNSHPQPIQSRLHFFNKEIFYGC